MKATSHLQVVLSLGMSGAVSFVPLVPLWHGQGKPLPYHLYLTTWNGVLLEKFIVPQLVKKFPAYVNQKFHHHVHKSMPLPVQRQINSV